MPFIMTQQVQPDFIMADMQSQQAWIIAQQALSPLVQVMVQPSSVVSHWHIPITRLQQQATMPLTCIQHEHMPPASMVQRFCIIAAAILSSVLQTIFMPPVHFSMVTLHRGTIIMFIPVDAVDGMPIVPIPWPVMPIPGLSIITALVMLSTPELLGWQSEVRLASSRPLAVIIQTKHRFASSFYMKRHPDTMITKNMSTINLLIITARCR